MKKICGIGPLPWLLMGALASLTAPACSRPGESPGAPAAAGWPAWAGEPGAGLRTKPFAPQRQQSAPGEILQDIVNHLPSQYGSTYYDSDKITWAHETSHGIHAHIRNTLNDTGRRANGFYLTGDKAAVVVEPAIRKSQVAAYVPAVLRGSRFDMYVLGQGAWDDTPLYIVDEWNAYINGAAAGIDLVQRGLWDQGPRDGVEGMMEFVAYGLALGMAVKDLDPDYFATYPQFAELLAREVEESMRLFRIGARLAPFQRSSQEKLFETLRTGAPAAPLRAFAARLFGGDWTDRVLLAPLAAGGPPPGPEGDGPGDATADSDQDGIKDAIDRCSGTPAGATVWKVGEWIGCAEGQSRDH